MKAKRKVIGLKEEIILIIAGGIFLMMLLSMNVLIAPEDNARTTYREITFDVFGLSKEVLLDDNLEFTSPIVLTDKPFKALLEPGTYYWKSGLSEVKTFTIESKVAIDTKQIGDELKVKNVGNTQIKLNFENGGLFTGHAVLGVGESLRKKSITKVIAEQNE